MQTRYPDGIPFNVIDKRDTFFKEDSNSVFRSKGYRLGSARNQTSTLTDDLISKDCLIATDANGTSREEAKMSNYKHIENQLTGMLSTHLK